jgi:hypothetical protein
VVQACADHPRLGEAYAVRVLGLATMLTLVAQEGAAAHRRSNGGTWDVVASLATALAAGSYTAHVVARASDAESAGGAALGADSSSVRPESLGISTSTAITTGSSSSSNSAAGAASCTQADGDPAGAPPCPADCPLCCVASNLVPSLQSHNKAGCRPPSMQMMAADRAHVQAAQDRGITLQQYLQQELLALAWQHPVLYVCCNVLCGRLEGPSALGAVRGLRGTLCRRCRAAWYCCEACQRAAWEEHQVVCKVRRRAAPK